MVPNRPGTTLSEQDEIPDNNIDRPRLGESEPAEGSGGGTVGARAGARARTYLEQAFIGNASHRILTH
jgi:hypothetical protein